MWADLETVLKWAGLLVGPPGLVAWVFFRDRKWRRELGELRADFIVHMRALHGASEDATDPRLRLVRAKGL